jgi:hypothetical protein
MKTIIRILGIIVAMIAFNSCDSQSTRNARHRAAHTDVFISWEKIIGFSGTKVVFTYQGDTLIRVVDPTTIMDQIGIIIPMRIKKPQISPNSLDTKYSGHERRK